MNGAALTGTIGFIGAGQMARALAGGFVKQHMVAPQQIIATDPSPSATDLFCAALAGDNGRARIAAGNVELVAASNVVFLAVKPQNVATVFDQLRPADGSGRLFVSIVAGLTCQRLAAGLDTDRIVRVMPNTPCLVGCGMSGFALGTGATQDDAEMVQTLLSSVGQAVQLDEAQLDAVTGLSGSGPAFVYQVIQAMAEGGVRMGLDQPVALQLAAQTVLGAATMVIKTGDSPEDLTDRVASPNGTTVAGLKVLQEKHLRSSVAAAVAAAARRSQELGAAPQK